jgi:3-oxoacyl-[acyl-carrier-protein] synthase-3
MASILGTGHYAPKKILTNQDLEKIVDTSDEWIRTRTGIRERHIAERGELTSDMAVGAARQAMESASVSAEDLDAIIMATITPDMPWPSCACIVQDKLGAKRAFAMDVSAACSGFIYALSMAAAYVHAGMARRVLVLGGDKLTGIVNWKDRNTCVLFGDGAAAAVVGLPGEGHDLLSFHLGADGSAAELLCMPAGGTKLPTSAATLEAGQNFIHMAGKEVFKFAVKVMVDASDEAITKAGLRHDQIDLFIPHQANIRIIEAAAQRIELPMEKVLVNIDRYGNTSAAAVGIALDEAVRGGRLKPGQHAVLVAFGGGLTWASTVVQW